MTQTLHGIRSKRIGYGNDGGHTGADNQYVRIAERERETLKQYESDPSLLTQHIRNLTRFINSRKSRKAS